MTPHAQFRGHVLAGLAGFLLLSACSGGIADRQGGPHTISPPPQDRALEPTRPLRVTTSRSARSMASEPDDAIMSDGLTLAEALDAAIARHPELIAASYEVGAVAAEVRQAGLRPNPELQTDIENFAGAGAMSGFGAAETTVSLGQLIELGGKRRKRVEAAERSLDLAEWDREISRLSVMADVTRLYVDAVAADRKADLAEELYKAAIRLKDAVQNRVEAGAVSPIELERAKLVVGRARSDLVQARAGKKASANNLFAMIGIEAPPAAKLTGRLDDIAVLPPHDFLVGQLAAAPRVQRAQQTVASRAAQLDLEKAKRIPDPTVGAGTRYFGETDTSALVATFSIPLPFFDRNQGATSAARMRLDGARAAVEATELGVRRDFEDAYAKLTSAASRAQSLETELLPAATRTFEATRTGYQEGKFDLVTLLDAQRAYFETEGESIDAAAAYFIARADLEELIGRPLPAAE